MTGREDEKFESYLYFLCNNFDFLKYTRNKKKYQLLCQLLDRNNNF